MNRKVWLYVAAASFILIQSCHKTEVTVKSKTPTLDHTSGLNLNSTGEYGTFQLINSVAGLSAEVSGLSLANGGTGDLATYSGTAHQQWRLTYMGNGYFTIMNLGSGKYAQSYNYQGQQVLIQNSADSTDDQLWNIVAVGDKAYKALSKTSGLAITGDGPNMIQLRPYTSLASQIWGYDQLPPTAYRDDAVVNFFHRTLTTEGSVAFDQGSSIPLSDGRVLWIAEDSFDGNELQPDGNLKCYIFEYRNSVMIQPASHTWNPNLTPNITIPNSTDGRPKQVFDIQPNTEWSWPGVGVEIGNKAYVYCGEGSGLGATNQSMYELNESETSNVWTTKRDTPSGMSNQTDIGYATGFVKPGDGYVYAYGGKGVFFNANNMYVARFAESDPLTWTFWNGTAWTSTRTSANSASIAGTQSNATVSYIHGKYVLMQMDLGYLCDPSTHNIYLSTSTSPTGPFTKPVKVFTIEDMYRGHLNRYYTPMIHPEFDNGKNELLLTYCVNFAACSTGDDCLNNEEMSIEYQVKGVRVPYSIIGL
jgi:hypothetical protein